MKIPLHNYRTLGVHYLTPQGASVVLLAVLIFSSIGLQLMNPLDISFHNDGTPGEMIERVDGDVADLAIFFATFAIRVLGNLFLLVGVLPVLLHENWRISLAFTAHAIVALGALIRLREIAKLHRKATRAASADLFGFPEEQLAGTEDIRSKRTETALPSPVWSSRIGGQPYAGPITSLS